MQTMTDKADAHLPHALRILARDIHCEDGIATQCIREAADEIDRLRAQPCPYVTGTVTRYCTLTRFTLTDAEREAVVRAWHGLLKLAHHEPSLIDEHLAGARAINALLERTRNG